MARHIAWDVGAAGVARALARRLDSPAILSDFRRLVIDPNRGEDDPTLVMRLYDGTIIPANRHMTAAGHRRTVWTASTAPITPPMPPGRRRPDTVIWRSIPSPPA
jgi:predicted N-formylglutamate amidohydrolase